MPNGIIYSLVNTNLYTHTWTCAPPPDYGQIKFAMESIAKVDDTSNFIRFHTFIITFHTFYNFSDLSITRIGSFQRIFHAFTFYFRKICIIKKKNSFLRVNDSFKKKKYLNISRQFSIVKNRDHFIRAVVIKHGFTISRLVYAAV